MDQRGGGTSTPSLDCPELDDPATPPGEAIQACRYRLDQRGVDRGSVTVGSTAADLVHLRRSLGIDAWHLHGVSSGTRIALELLRIDGSSVASAVLDSPTPPEVDLYDDLPEGVLYALTSMENLCRADATCPGGLVGPLRSILDDLADRPGVLKIHAYEQCASITGSLKQHADRRVDRFYPPADHDNDTGAFLPGLLDVVAEQRNNAAGSASSPVRQLGHCEGHQQFISGHTDTWSVWCDRDGRTANAIPQERTSIVIKSSDDELQRASGRGDWKK